MSTVQTLLVIFIVSAAALTEVQGENGKTRAGRQKRGLLDNFIGLLQCSVDDNDYMSLLSLTRVQGGTYGCYCGVNIGIRSSSGNENPDPQDAIDACCENHDKCWADANEQHTIPNSRCYGYGWFRRCFPDVCAPIWKSYQIEQGTEDTPCSCNGGNGPCEAALCKCDEDFISCVSGVGLDNIQDPKPTCP